MTASRFSLLLFLSFMAFGCHPSKQSAKQPTKQPTKQQTKQPTKTETNTDSNASPFRSKVVNYGQKFVGTTYKYAGQSPKTGFDCSGFTSYVLNNYGVTVSPASAIQATEGHWIALDKVLPGDLIFFGESTKKISHVALVVKRGPEGITCVHATTSRGVIVENVSQSTYWKTKILFARDVISDGG